MKRAIVLALLFVFPSLLHAGLIKWEGKPISVLISTERLTRIEFPESLRSAFLSRSDIVLEKEDRSLYVRALALEVEDTLFVVGESETTYELKLSTSDNPDQTVVISSIPKSFQAQADRARQVPALDLLRSMMRGLPRDGYEIIKADKKEVYRDAFFSMKLVEAYRSPVFAATSRRLGLIVVGKSHLFDRLISASFEWYLMPHESTRPYGYPTQTGCRD